jgi:cysteine sulfinate desulfinase
VPGVDAQEVALLLNEQGVLLRAGQHCAHMYFSHINKEGFVRASFHLYTSKEDVVTFIESLKDVLEVVC